MPSKCECGHREKLHCKKCEKCVVKFCNCDKCVNRVMLWKIIFPIDPSCTFSMIAPFTSFCKTAFYVHRQDLVSNTL